MIYQDINGFWTNLSLECYGWISQVDWPAPCGCLHRSPAVSSQSDEDGLVRLRRRNSRKFARLLDLKRDYGRKPQSESSEQTQTHISAPPLSFVNQQLGSTLAENFQHSESSRSLKPHKSDVIDALVNHILSSDYQQPFFAAQNYDNPATNAS